MLIIFKHEKIIVSPIKRTGRKKNKTQSSLWNNFQQEIIMKASTINRNSYGDGMHDFTHFVLGKEKK